MNRTAPSHDQPSNPEGPTAATDVLGANGAPTNERPTRVLLVGPSMDILGGQAIVLQRLLGRLSHVDRVQADFCPVNPRLAGVLGRLQRIKYVRTILTSARYVLSLLTTVPRYDVIHIFSASYFSFVLAPTPALLIARIFRKPSVLNYRSGEAEDHLRRWKTARRTAASATRIVVPSGYLVDVFGKFGLAAEAIPNAVDLTTFQHRDRGPCDPVFLSNRNFAAHYNVGCILRAFRIIQDSHPQARLIVSGDGDERDHLHALRDELALEHVDFLGQVPPARMAELYTEVDVYLNSSSIDNMPNSIVEAYACGLPVVSTDAGGIPYMVEDGATGLLVAVDDHEALAAAALRVLGDPELALRLSRGGRAKCEAEYTWSAATEAWVRLYEGLAPE